MIIFHNGFAYTNVPEIVTWYSNAFCNCY